MTKLKRKQTYFLERWKILIKLEDNTLSVKSQELYRRWGYVFEHEYKELKELGCTWVR